MQFCIFNISDKNFYLKPTRTIGKSIAMKIYFTLIITALVAACGGGGGSTPTPAQVNRAPVLTDPGALSVVQGATSIATIIASDPDNNSLTFTISSGDDQALFSITSSGVLSFLVAPDFESPSDAGSDNIYDLTVQVSDGTLTDTQSISITVTDALAFEQSSLVVDIAVSALQDTCAEDGVQQQFVLPVNLNDDDLVDFIVHYWCTRTDSGVFDDGPTPDLLVAYVSNSNGSYAADNETYFGISNPKLGGASRNFDAGDLNDDGKPDFAFAVNREDLRSIADVETIAVRPALLLSTTGGYEVQNLGIPDWGHAVGIIENKVIFSGFNISDSQVFTYVNGLFEDVTSSNYSRYSAGGFDGYGDYIVQGTMKTIDGKSFVGFELLRSDGSALDEFLFEEQFKIQREASTQDGGAYEERIVYAKENGDLFFDSLANEVQVFESDNEILVVAIYDTHVFSGSEQLVSNQRVDQDQRIPKKEIFLFRIANESLESKNDDIDYSFGDDFVQFFDVFDLNNDGSPDLQFSVMDNTFVDSQTLIDGVPRVFLNNGNNGFEYVNDDEFIKTQLLENGQGRGFVYDVNGDQLPDFVRFSFNSNIQNVKIEIYLAKSNFFE